MSKPPQAPPALDAVAPEFRPVFIAALRHLQQPDRQAVRALVGEFCRLSLAAEVADFGAWAAFRFREFADFKNRVGLAFTRKARR